MSLYEVVKGLQDDARRHSTGGRSYWSNFLKKLHEPNDPLFQALIVECGAGETSMESRRDDKITALNRLDWGKEYLRKEVFKLAARLPIYKDWDPSKPQDFLNTSLQDQLQQIRMIAPYFCNLLEEILQPYWACKNEVFAEPSMRHSIRLKLQKLIFYGLR